MPDDTLGQVWCISRCSKDLLAGVQKYGPQTLSSSELGYIAYASVWLVKLILVGLGEKDISYNGPDLDLANVDVAQMLAKNACANHCTDTLRFEALVDDTDLVLDSLVEHPDVWHPDIEKAVAFFSIIHEEADRERKRT
jgi:hypothetical protein